MTESFDKPARVELCDAAARWEPVDWEEVFGDYRATVDWPGCVFCKELLEAHPDAKVLLNIRDSKSWYKSTMNTIYGGPKTVHASRILSLMRMFVPAMGRAAQITNDIIWTVRTPGTSSGGSTRSRSSSGTSRRSSSTSRPTGCWCTR